METFYRRRLPHWHPEGASIFLTWRLRGSLPHQKEWLALPTEGQRFVAMDRMMDRAATGPLWLKDPRVADCVVETILRGEKEWRLYELHSWGVMSNHVHLLIDPLRPLAQVTQSLKKMSAREASRILGRSELPFWQDESYDHWVRNTREFDRIVRYIEENPVKAGVVGRAEEWPWSSASPRFVAGQIGTLPHRG